MAETRQKNTKMSQRLLHGALLSKFVWHRHVSSNIHKFTDKSFANRFKHHVAK